MKSMSIRFKITLWFSAAMIIIVVITLIVVLAVSNQVIQKTIRDSLIETVENNVDEVEYFSTLENVDLENDVDHFIMYGDGYLEIDDDFLDEVNEVYTSLCMSDGTLVYGENPVAQATAALEFNDSQVQKVTVDGVLYYVFDRQLTEDGLEGLWLRGVVSEEQGAVQMVSITRTSLILLPSIVVIAIIGGYLVAGRMLKPLDHISEAVEQIEQGGDLKKRIDIGGGKDELHRLADDFNMMFERLDDAFQSERQFTSDASHELRTPVAVISAQCEYALEEERSTEEYEEALTVIRRQSKKMSKLISDMLDVTRLEMNSDRYTLEDIDLSELVSSSCFDMALIARNGIELTSEIDDGIHMTANYALMTRLLANLVGNAYRYGKENGHISVSLHKDNNVITLSVGDDGIGIAEDELDKIFMRFYQSDNSRSGEGSGLGLSMVREIAQFHGGTVRVESELGKGSVFICTFPLKSDNT